jgi:rare lipoprotein A
VSTLRAVGLLAIFGLFAGCAQIPAEHQTSSANDTAQARTQSAPSVSHDLSDDASRNITANSEAIAFQPVKGTLQSGAASWYARKFEGRRTASGERYDGRSLTAAHRTLPLGTYVRVTSLATGKSVVVRINDRGPFVKGRIIDLSYAAANALGLTRVPSMRVQIERVESAVGNAIGFDESES